MNFPSFPLPGEVGEEKRRQRMMVEGKGPNDVWSAEKQKLQQPGDHVPPL